MASLGNDSGSLPPRRDQFKAPVGTVGGQRRRQQAISVGKERRDAVVRAKRVRRTDDNDEGSLENETVAMHEEVSDKALDEDTFDAVEDLKAAVASLAKGSSQRKMEALRRLRRLLSCNAMPPVDAAIQAGAVPVLVKCLDFGSSDEQLVEAAWCLTNIASGDSDQTRAVVPALPLLIAHLGERSAVPVAEQCAWAVGNVAGEGEHTRDILIAQGALFPLARLLLSNKTSTARTAAWALSNLIKGPSPKAALQLIKLENVPGVITQHMSNGDEDLAVEVAWVVVYLTSLLDSHSGLLAKAGLLPPLAGRLASSEKLSLLTPVLRSIGNFVAGDSLKTDAIFDAAINIPGGIIGALVHCLESQHRTLQKEAAWTISNIVAGSLQHKELVFRGGAVGPLLHLLATSSFDVRKEVAYALGNLSVLPGDNSTVTQPILEHLTVLVDRGCLPGYINLVKSPDLEASRLGLQFLELVMRGLPNGQGPKLVEKEDGIAALEILEYHENEELRCMANMLIDKYFGADYGLEEEYGQGMLDMIKSDEGYPPWRKGGIVNA